LKSQTRLQTDRSFMCDFSDWWIITLGSISLIDAVR